jgi:lipoprotein-anchoring transpeptidase ErfK/SrfK
MTDRNGNLNKNSRSGSREDGREPVRRNTAMNSREIMLEDEDYLDEPDEGYLDDDYFDRDMEERILREAELDMENIHQSERQDQNRWEEPERLPEKEPEETASRKRSRARGNQSAGTGREAAHAAPQRGQDSGKTASWTEATPEKAALKAEHRKNGKKAAWIAACTAGILLVAAGGVYAGMSQKYKTRFFPNTQINGVDASGKTAAEVQELIAEGVNGYTLTITERNNQTETIAGTDIKLHAEFDGSLEKMVAAQNPFAWLGHVKQEEYTIGTMVAYDDAALESQIRNLSCLDPEKAVEPVNAKISEYVSGQGYSIEPEQEGTAVEAEKLTQAVTGAIENLQDHLSLEEADVYKKPTVLKDDASLAEQLDKMNKYAKMSVTYQFGDSTETLNGDQIHAWLIANADGSVSVDSSKVSEYVSEMAKAHNTSNKAKTLKTSYGSTIQVSGGTYGWKINQAAETEALAAIIASGESTTREPEYSQKAASHGANDYGDTYVEINLTGQHLFFYKEGKLVVESDFVSGNLAKGWGTPAGSYPLAYKQKNAVLKGENYRTPVNYWMPFNNGIGMHDAKWRSSFGGTIYKTGGSHGCINLPPSVAKTIFDNISAGTPVICYNLPGTEKSTTSGTAKPAETKPAETTAPAETPAPAETQAPAPAETQAPGPAPTTAPTQAETKAPETAAPTQAGPGGPSGDNGGNIAVGPGA